MKPRIVIPIAIAAALAATLAVPALRHRSLEAVQHLGGAAPESAEARVTAESRGQAPDSSPTSNNPDAPRAASLAVAGVVVQSEPFVLTARATGRAEALQRAQLACRVGECVTAVHVHEGQRVRRGELLVELDPRSFEMALREAEARLASARIDFSALAFNDSVASLEKRDRMAARTGVTEAEQRVARAQMDLDATRITAPFDGEIVSRAVNVGERAQPERPLVTLVDRSRIRVPAEVLEASFAHLSPGAKASVRFPALGGTRFEGRITALAPELDTARGTGIAYVEIANNEGRIKPGMYCEVEIEAARFDSRLAVPRAAVLERSRRLLVFVARHGRAEWAYVDTGLETDDRIEITSGIAPGDTVLVDGHLTLAHGAPVSVSLVSGTPVLP